MRQTGQDVQLSVDAVASKGELAELMARITRPEPIIPKVNTVAESQKELLDNVRPVIQELWPSDAPIQDFDVVLSTAGMALDVRYRSAGDLGQAAINTVLQGLRTKLGIPDLMLNAERIPPAIPVNTSTKATEKRKRKVRIGTHSHPAR
jgi:hypothetical protein